MSINYALQCGRQSAHFLNRSIDDLLTALGALLAFLCDELIMIKNLGGIRLKYYSIWVCLLMIGGYWLMLLGAWMNTPIM